MNSSLPTPTNDSSRLPPPADAEYFASELYAHDAALKAHLRRAFPGVRDVDDIVQESYLRVWRRHVAAPITSAKGFLFKVARRLAIDVLRRRNAAPFAVTDFDESSVIDHGQDVIEATCTRQEMEALFEAIDALPRRCREIVILRKLEGLSQKEIAARLGISEQTVQVQACRGLQRCNEYLARRGMKGGSL